MKTNTEIVKEKLKEIEQIEKTPDEHIEPCHECENLPLLKANLSGMQTAIKSELEFLEELESHEVLKYHSKRDCEFCIRITDCKNDLKLIEEGK